MTIHTYILIFAIGPVQSFIAEARRTLDLYTGSQMLAQVARAAAKAVSDNGELIYPTKESLEAKEVDTPNKFVALVTDPSDVAKKAREAAEHCWRDFADKAWAKVSNRNDPELLTIWQHQRDNLLEFYWAAAHFDGDYKKAYELADNTLNARKQTRDFSQGIEDGFKDSLSGSRSALRAKDDKDARVYWERMRKRRLVNQLQEGELLDTIGVMKRFAFADNDKKKFPSVSTVASACFACACHKAGLLAEFTATIGTFNRQAQDLDFSAWPTPVIEDFNQWVGEYFYKVGDFNRGFMYDGDLLYPETYTVQRLQNSYGRPPSPNVQEVKAALEKLYKTAKKKETSTAPSQPLLCHSTDGWR